MGRGKRNTAVIEQKLRQDHTAEEKRKSHQQELMEKMNEAALKRIKEGGTDKVETKVCKGVLDLEMWIDYFVVPGSSCESLDFPTICLKLVLLKPSQNKEGLKNFVTALRKI